MAEFHIDRLLDTVIKQEASDLHLTVHKPPTVRIRGRMVELKTKPLTPDDTAGLMESIAPDRARNELQEEMGADFGFGYGDDGEGNALARFRVSIFLSKGNTTLVLRRIPSELMSIESIGLPKIVPDLIRRPRGLFW